MSTIQIIIVVGAVVGGSIATIVFELLGKLIKNKTTSVKAERVADTIRNDNVTAIAKQVHTVFDSARVILSDVKPRFDNDGQANIVGYENEVNNLATLVAKLEKYDQDELINATLQQKAEKRNIAHLKNKIAGFKIKK